LGVEQGHIIEPFVYAQPIWLLMLLFHYNLMELIYRLNEQTDFSHNSLFLFALHLCYKILRVQELCFDRNLN